jgi:hypothetical protein
MGESALSGAEKEADESQRQQVAGHGGVPCVRGRAEPSLREALEGSALLGSKPHATCRIRLKTRIAGWIACPLSSK